MAEEKKGRITKVAGPLVVAEGMDDAKMFDVVKVSDEKLIGEIIELKGDKASIQVYEETSGIGPGEPIYLTGKPLSVELGPGLLQNFYDGIQRPLESLMKKSGAFITRGIEAKALDRKKKWEFKPVAKVGDEVEAGDIIGEVEETTLITHKVMVPFGVKGKIEKIASGNFTVEEPVAKIDGTDVIMLQVWPIRQPRTIKEKLPPKETLVTGQRIIDTFFPIVKGGTACVPGPFGSGKTVVQHALSKWSDAEIIIFIGCGERGNEMTDVLTEFPELKDPHSGEPLMKRTVLIANTSNMPVAAREASIYTGITLGEYYRDMGYKVALMADSTSRWAEALREISGRLEEMPGEEGYPAYLGSRTAAFYERAGFVSCLGADDRTGSLSVIGAVSPPGGDLSEPVTQNTLRVVKVFWGLDAQLAYRRHYPAINWLTSYSLYLEDTEEFMKKETDEDYVEIRSESMKLLQEESGLQEIVKLVGLDALSGEEQWLLEISKSLREDFLQQNAFDDIDAYSSIKKQYLMLKSIVTFYHEGQAALKKGITLKQLQDLENLKIELSRAKSIEEKDIAALDELLKKIPETVQKLKTED
ncbi:MAG: V-type ATP synthase subunit A [Patescibacteria group bacterium]